MLPIILQHVREFEEVNASGPERDRYKIITPFPPNSSDFPDFDAGSLAFGDPPSVADSASLDTVQAFDFFRRTDSLYYDYSYGIRSDDYSLSQICHRFFSNARTASSDLSFRTAFAEKTDAFMHRYLRSTAGDLGNYDFRFTSLSPISWRAERVVINAEEVERLRAKAVQLYEDLDMQDSGAIKSLIEEVRAKSYSSIEYDFGSFEVIREWLDPRLFDSGEWTFSSGDRILYGGEDPFFAANEVRLCYAQRFCVVKNYVGTPLDVPLPPSPVVRDQRGMLGGRTGGSIGVTIGEDRLRSADPGLRQQLRNDLLRLKLGIASAFAGAPVEAPKIENAGAEVPKPRAGYVWVAGNSTVAGHWERARAGMPDPPKLAETSSYKIAAVKCRVVPRSA